MNKADLANQTAQLLGSLYAIRDKFKTLNDALENNNLSPLAVRPTPEEIKVIEKRMKSLERDIGLYELNRENN